MNQGARIIGYARVSTAQQGESDVGLESQREAIRRFAAQKGYELVGIEEDVRSGKSAKKRPGLQRALNACRRGDVAGVVFAKLDRATRSLIDFSEMVADADKHGYTIAAVDQDFDLSTSHGRAMAGMLAVFAQFERDMISERVRAGMAVVKNKGTKSGKPVGRPTLYDDTIRKRVRRERRAGKNLSEIARLLEADGTPTATGGTRWHARQVARLLA